MTRRSRTDRARERMEEVEGGEHAVVAYFKERVYATFTPALKIAAPLRGNIGLISQSGAFGIFALMLAQRRGLGVSHFVSTGNEADIELADALAWAMENSD